MEKRSVRARQPHFNHRANPLDRKRACAERAGAATAVGRCVGQAPRARRAFLREGGRFAAAAAGSAGGSQRRPGLRNGGGMLHPTRTKNAMYNVALHRRKGRQMPPPLHGTIAGIECSASEKRERNHRAHHARARILACRGNVRPRRRPHETRDRRARSARTCKGKLHDRYS